MHLFHTFCKSIVTSINELWANRDVLDRMLLQVPSLAIHELPKPRTSSQRIVSLVNAFTFYTSKSSTVGLCVKTFRFRNMKTHSLNLMSHRCRQSLVRHHDPRCTQGQTRQEGKLAAPVGICMRFQSPRISKTHMVATSAWCVSSHVWDDLYLTSLKRCPREKIPRPAPTD